MTNDQRYQYARAVWTEFKNRTQPCSRITLDQMTCAEWWLIARWMDADVPLRVVLRGFEDTKGEKARTLLYFAGPVEQAYRHWREAVNG